MLCAVCAVLMLLISGAGWTVNGQVHSPHYMAIGCHKSVEHGVELERCHGLYTLERTWNQAIDRCQSDGWNGLALADNAHVDRTLGDFMVWMNDELDADNGYSAWIGGHEVNDRAWTWSDGTAFQRQFHDDVHRLDLNIEFLLIFLDVIRHHYSHYPS